MIHICDSDSSKMREERRRRLKCAIAISQYLNQVVAAGDPAGVCVEADQQIELAVMVEVNGK